MDAAVYRALAFSSLFRGLDEVELSGLIETKNFLVRSYHRGAIIAFRGDRYEELWIVAEGRLRAEFQNHRGKVLKVESLKVNELVASSVLFAADPCLPVTLIAEEDSKLFGVTRPSLSREFSRLCEEKIIGREGHIVHFLDREALADIIDSP
jgi:CRP/FNR family transcriptional regulator, dissimilatory nitrate respiration regulator